MSSRTTPSLTENRIQKKYWDVFDTASDSEVWGATQDLEVALEAGKIHPEEALRWIAAGVKAGEEHKEAGRLDHGWDADFDFGALERAATMMKDLGPILRKIHGKKTVHVRLKSGRANVNNYVVHRSTRPNKGSHPIQISEFDGKMEPWGHRERKGTMEDALREVWKEDGPFELVIAESMHRTAPRLMTEHTSQGVIKKLFGSVSEALDHLGDLCEALEPGPEGRLKDLVGGHSHDKRATASKIVSYIDANSSSRLNMAKVKAGVADGGDWYFLGVVPVRSLDHEGVEPSGEEDLRKPIVVGRDGVILDGRHRTALAKQKGVKELPAWRGSAFLLGEDRVMFRTPPYLVESDGPTHSFSMENVMKVITKTRQPFLVVGAHAAKAHIRSFRETKDLDIVVPDRAACDKIADALGRAFWLGGTHTMGGHVVSVPDEVDDDEFPGFEWDETVVDILVRGDGFDVLKSRATRKRVLGSRPLVPSLKDLVRTKEEQIASGRTQWKDKDGQADLRVMRKHLDQVVVEHANPGGVIKVHPDKLRAIDLRVKNVWRIFDRDPELALERLHSLQKTIHVLHNEFLEQGDTCCHGGVHLRHEDLERRLYEPTQRAIAWLTASLEDQEGKRGTGGAKQQLRIMRKYLRGEFEQDEVPKK